MSVMIKIRKFIILALILIFTLAILAVFPGAKDSKKADKHDSVELPIIMYHSLLRDKKLQNDYTISPDSFEKDLQYITRNNYSTVTVSDLVEYVYSDKPLPEKCIMLTFDDGYYNNYYYAFPLLKKYGCKAVISPIAFMTEKYTADTNISINYGHINADNIREMVSSGLVEIQNHSYNMHSLTPRRGVEQKSAESDAEYRSIIEEDITHAQEYLNSSADVLPSCFVYPFGAKSSSTLEVIKKIGFVSTMTCTEKINLISRDPDSLFELGRYRRVPRESVEQILHRSKSNTDPA